MDYRHIFSFLGGLAAGAIIALLLAPDKGSETRRKISEKLKEKGIHLTGEELDEFINMLKDKIGVGKPETVTAEANEEAAAEM